LPPSLSAQPDLTSSAGVDDVLNVSAIFCALPAKALIENNAKKRN